MNLSGPMLAPKSGAAPSQLVVLLHGYGSDGNDLISLGAIWRDLLPDALFVAPDAPNVCDINPAGFQWFPVDIDKGADKAPNIIEPRTILIHFLAEVWAQTGLSANDTILCGFSQGAMMALDVGLRLPQKVRGIIAFSGALVSPETLPLEITARPPVLLVHGDADPIVPVGRSIAAEKELSGLDVPARLLISEGTPHTIPEDGLEAAAAFLAQIMDEA